MTFSLPVQHSPDGDYLDLTRFHSSAFVLCYNKGSGLVPIRITSGKKIFVRELEQLAADNPEIAEFTVVPITDYINLAKL